ncbi:MAG TPA: glycosyltransferase [Acetobacteraceae bacterium]|nr:glycosyltransferase [Acetobacteraceae bacterium]
MRAPAGRVAAAVLNPRPASETLALAGRNRIAWAEFDPDWYLARHPEAAAALCDPGPDAVLGYYLDTGAARRHSPNALFDEAWYLEHHPGVATAVEAGHFRSGFDHYCLDGHANFSPHWLFDAALYRARYTDLGDEVLAAGEFANGYDHFLKHGSREGRIGHVLFDPARYRAGLDADAARECEALGAFRHFLSRLDAGAGENWVSDYFDPDFYRARYPEVATAIAAGEWRAAIEHYLRNPTPTRFDPLAWFSEEFYLARYPDIAVAVAAGRLRNGYWHFLTDGAGEMRAPHPRIDLAWYVSAHPEVRTDLAESRAPDAFTHYLRIGRAQGLAATPPVDEPVTELAGRSVFRARARNLLPLWGRAPLDFTVSEAPVLSVIMVLHGQFALSMMALASLRANFAGPIELILVDSGSEDETLRITRYVRGARLLRFDSNIGFVRACNAGLYSVTSPAVLFLNNDVELGPGAIAAALRRMASDARIGAVGGKVIRGHGALQEAGSIIWRDGSTAGYLRDASPLAPEANFVRDVDYCSGVFLLVRAALLIELDGFAEDFAPAYYEDADLCVRIAQAGHRVVYDPAIVVHHLEHGSAGTAAVAQALIARGHAAFVARHADWLTGRCAPGDALAARATDLRRRVLFIEDTLPLRLLGSGFVRSNDLVAVMAEMGFHVTVFPVERRAFDLAAVYADFPDTVEVVHDRDIDDLAAFLRERAGYFDALWVARTHNLERIVPRLPDSAPRHLILDTEAIAALRDAGRAILLDPAAAFDLPEAMRQEFAHASHARTLIAVSEAEAAALREMGFDDVHVLGHCRAVAPTPAGWAERAGMLFVGAIHREDAPNYDGLCWFVDEVLPLVERELGWQTRLTVAGHVGEGVGLERFASHPRITLRGTVADTLPLYAGHRVFVAPTRYAAGLPYKVNEAASFGVPVVATGLLREQLGWTDGEDILAAPAADPARFAALIVALHRGEALWQRIRAGGLARVARENGREHYVRALTDMLG